LRCAILCRGLSHAASSAISKRSFRASGCRCSSAWGLDADRCRSLIRLVRAGSRSDADSHARFEQRPGRALGDGNGTGHACLGDHVV
jgi:hypothetical protein